MSDGNLVLKLEVLSEEEGGGFGVISPMEPSLLTKADSLDEAFSMARDAIQSLLEARTEREIKARETAKRLATASA